MADDIIEELWRIKDGIAREYGYDVDALAAHLATQTPLPSSPAADPSTTRASDHEPPVMTNNPRAGDASAVIL